MLAWMNTGPLYRVLHVRFSIRFAPVATAQAHGCFNDRIRVSDVVAERRCPAGREARRSAISGFGISYPQKSAAAEM
jgi:hypothetical protein